MHLKQARDRFHQSPIAPQPQFLIPLPMLFVALQYRRAIYDVGVSIDGSNKPHRPTDALRTCGLKLDGEY